jgi:NAD(P)-dependent dehydrogenase (short-subunit alcohol dehydrogenase family)
LTLGRSVSSFTRVKIGVSMSGYSVLIGPAMVDTPLAAPVLSDPEKRAQFMSQIPMGRLCEPQDILATVVLLMAPGGSYITGQTIFVDGGRTLL